MLTMTKGKPKKAQLSDLESKKSKKWASTSRKAKEPNTKKTTQGSRKDRAQAQGQTNQKSILDAPLDFSDEDGNNKDGTLMKDKVE